MKPRLWLAIFILLQFADGVLTYAAVDRFGPNAEGNPILLAWIVVAGAMPAVFGAKLLACACGGVLYAAGVYRVLVRADEPLPYRPGLSHTALRS